MAVKDKGISIIKDGHFTDEAVLLADNCPDETFEGIFILKDGSKSKPIRFKLEKRANERTRKRKT